MAGTLVVGRRQHDNFLPFVCIKFPHVRVFGQTALELYSSSRDYLHTVYFSSVRDHLCRSVQLNSADICKSLYYLFSNMDLSDLSHHPCEIKSCISYIVVSTREPNFICCFNINICDLYSRQFSDQAHANWLQTSLLFNFLTKRKLHRYRWPRCRTLRWLISIIEWQVKTKSIGGPMRMEIKSALLRELRLEFIIYGYWLTINDKF